MSAIDIRAVSAEDVDEIVFSDSSHSWASKLVKGGGGSFVRLGNIEGDEMGDVLSADVPNLLLALKKAQELGWF